MFKKLAVAALSAVCLGAMSVFSQTWDCGADYCASYYNIDGCDTMTVTCVLDSDGTLTVSGSGALDSYTYAPAPWHDVKNSIVRVVIEDGVAAIGNGTFTDHTEIVSVTIPGSVTIIGGSSFRGCTALETVTFGEGLTYIGNASFSGCASLKAVQFPNSLKSIGAGAFYGCHSLESVAIPAGITDVHSLAFANCSGLTSFDAAEDSDRYVSVEGVLFNKDMTLLSQYPAGKPDTSYIIPGSVTRIPDEAFIGSAALRSVTIPAGVTFIGIRAFSDCARLASITCLAMEPPGVTFNHHADALVDPFYGLDRPAIRLLVPEDAMESYRAAYYYAGFNIGAAEAVSVRPRAAVSLRDAARVTVRNRTLTIHYTPSSSESVSRIRLIDTRGKVVARFDAGATAPGRPLSFPLTTIPAGRYFVEARDGVRRDRVSVVVGGR